MCMTHDSPDEFVRDVRPQEDATLNAHITPYVICACNVRVSVTVCVCVCVTVYIHEHVSAHTSESQK